MLDLLLSLKDEENNTGFTSQELQDHVMTFMSAGHEVWTKIYLILKELTSLALNDDSENNYSIIRIIYLMLSLT